MSDQADIPNAEPTPAPSFELRMLFDGSQTTLDDLKTKVETALGRPKEGISLQFNADDDGNIRLWLDGPLRAVDACHFKLLKWLETENLSWIREADSAGAEVRRLAFPIIARIEWRLRTFINGKATETLGFDWWRQYAPRHIQNRVKNLAGGDTQLESIEGTQFQDLVDLIEANVSDWPQDKTLSAYELNELMSQCATFEEFKAKIAEKFRKFSFWDSVFAPYFNDKEHWQEIRSALNLVITERHKVMHHRPMRLAMVTVLHNKDYELLDLYGQAKHELSPEERQNVQKAAEEFTTSYTTNYERLFSTTYLTPPSPEAFLTRHIASIPIQTQLQNARDILDSPLLNPQERERLLREAKQFLANIPSPEQIEEIKRFFGNR